MTVQVIVAGVSLLVAVIGFIKLIIKSRKDASAQNLQGELNEQLIEHAQNVADAVAEAQKEASRARALAERIAMHSLSADMASRVLSGKDPEGR